MSLILKIPYDILYHHIYELLDTKSYLNLRKAYRQLSKSEYHENEIIKMKNAKRVTEVIKVLRKISSVKHLTLNHRDDLSHGKNIMPRSYSAHYDINDVRFKRVDYPFVFDCACCGRTVYCSIYKHKSGPLGKRLTYVFTKKGQISKYCYYCYHRNIYKIKNKI